MFENRIIANLGKEMFNTFKKKLITICDLTLTTLKYFCINHGNQRSFFQFEIIINVLVLSASFEYLCYRSMAIINILILSAREPSLYVRIWRILTSDSDV